MARKFADKTAPPDTRTVWVSDKFTGKGTEDDPIDVTGEEGTPTPTPDSVPQSLEDGTLAAGWLPAPVVEAIRYVSPNGSDTNLGDDPSRPYATVKKAWDDIASIAGGDLTGGEIYVESGSSWTDDGHGLHVDGLGLAPGFVEPMNVRVIGCAGGNSGLFGWVSPALIYGGGTRASGEMDDPAIWISTTQSVAISFENIVVQPELNKPVRIGWDYHRDRSTGLIVKADVTAASRADGITVFTCDRISIDFRKISRSGNVVTVITDDDLSVKGSYFPCPFRAGSKVVVDYTSGDFSPGVFTVLSFAPGGAGGTGFTFASAGADFSDGTPGGAVIGTAESNCGVPNDFMVVYTGTTEFPASTYLIQDSDEDTVTVVDYYGYAPRSATVSDVDIGTYAMQDRFDFGCARLRLSNITGRMVNDATVDNFSSGPSLDCGPLEFFQFEDIGLFGNNTKKDGTEYGTRDPDRRCSLLFNTGSAALGIGFGLLERAPIGYGGIRYHNTVNGSLIMSIKHVCVDQLVGTTFLPVPAVEILNANQYCRILLEDISVVDASAPISAVIVNEDAPYQAVTVNGCYGHVTGPCTLLGHANISAVEQPSLNEAKQTGYYGGDRHIAGRHPGVYRNGFISAAPLQLFDVDTDGDTWTKTGSVTVTTGIRDPLGGNGAVRLTSAASGQAVTPLNHNSFGVAQVGDIFIAACWVRGTFSVGYAYQAFVKFNGNNSFKFLSEGVQPIQQSGDWSCIAVGGRLTDAGGNLPSANVSCSLTFYLASGEEVDVFEPTLARVSQDQEPLLWPNITDAELAEIITNIQTCPAYLSLPTNIGTAGTRPGQKFIAHGGLGVHSSILVGPSGGTASLANYEPRYDDDGSTILGYAPLMATAGGALAAAPGGAAGGDLTGTYPDPTVQANVITYAKMQDVSAASKLLGRGDSGSGDPQEITVGSGLTMTGTTLTGNAGVVPTGTGFSHVTAGALDAAAKLVDTADINADQVTYAKIQNVSATDRLLGRDTAGAGDIEELTATGGLEFTGTGIRTTAFTGDVTKAAGGTVTTLAAAPFAVIQTTLGAASGTIDVNAQQVTSAAAPSGANSFANKAYVDSVAAGLAPKGNARALSDSNIASLSGLSTTIDGVAINTDGYRVLLTGQSTATQNGLWVAHSGAWTRPTDFAIGSSAAGAYCFIELGTVYMALGFICNTPAGSAVVDTNNLTFQQFSGAGQVNAGTGMTKTGNTLNVVANADGTIVANADDIQVGSLVIGNVPNDLITYAKIQNVSAASKLLGRGDSGSGDVQELTLGTNLSMSGTTLNAAGGGGGAGTWTDFVQDIGKGFSGTFDMTDFTGLTAGKDVALIQTAQAIASKGDARDEFEFDAIQLTGYVVNATTVRVRWWAPGVVVGEYAFAFQVGG